MTYCETISLPSAEQPSEPGKYGYCIVCHKKADHYCSQTKDPVCGKECKQQNLERIEREEEDRRSQIISAAQAPSPAEKSDPFLSISFPPTL